MSRQKSKNWLGLVIGNSRLHWAWFSGDELKLSWHSSHLEQPIVDNIIPLQVFPEPSLSAKLE